MDRPPTLRTLGTVSPGCAFSMFSGTEQRCSSYRKPSCALDGRVTFLSPVVLYSFLDGGRSRSRCVQCGAGAVPGLCCCRPWLRWHVGLALHVPSATGREGRSAQLGARDFTYEQRVLFSNVHQCFSTVHFIAHFKVFPQLLTVSVIFIILNN